MRLDEVVVPKIKAQREEYASLHPDEFVEEGITHSESQGKTSLSYYLNVMAGTPEIQSFIRWNNLTNVFILRNIV